MTVEGNNEADRLAAVGLHSHPLNPYNPTPHKETAQYCTPPPPPKRFKADPHTPSVMDVSKQIDFSEASLVASPLCSKRAELVLQSVQLEAIGSGYGPYRLELHRFRGQLGSLGHSFHHLMGLQLGWF